MDGCHNDFAGGNLVDNIGVKGPDSASRSRLVTVWDSIRLAFVAGHLVDFHDRAGAGSCADSVGPEWCGVEEVHNPRRGAPDFTRAQLVSWGLLTFNVGDCRDHKTLHDQMSEVMIE
jgi:hypothetical protein